MKCNKVTCSGYTFLSEGIGLDAKPQNGQPFPEGIVCDPPNSERNQILYYVNCRFYQYLDAIAKMPDLYSNMSFLEWLIDRELGKLNESKNTVILY